MTTITKTTLDELLKRLYASWEIEDLVNLTAPVLADCARKGSADLGGDGFRFPVRVEHAHGHAYINEDDDLPAGRQSTVRQAVVQPKVHAGVVQLTGLSMAITTGNAMSFARSFDENVQSTLEAMTWYKEGAFFRDGTGLLTAFNGNPGTGTGPHTVDDVNYLREGMYVDVIDHAANTRHHTDLKVSGVDWVNKTVTFGSGLATAVDDNDELYIADSQGATGAPVNKEPEGLEASLLSTGTYLGISRSTYPNWQANTRTVSGFLDEDVLLASRTQLTQESGKDIGMQARSMKMLCHPQQVDVLFKLAMPRIRYTGNDTIDLGNRSNVMFGGIPFVTSHNCPPATAYLGDWSKSVSLFTPNGELHIDTEYNGSALKWVATKDVGLVFVKEYHNFAVKNPVCFLRLSSLSTPSR